MSFYEDDIHPKIPYKCPTAEVIYTGRWEGLILQYVLTTSFPSSFVLLSFFFGKCMWDEAELGLQCPIKFKVSGYIIQYPFAQPDTGSKVVDMARQD